MAFRLSPPLIQFLKCQMAQRAPWHVHGSKHKQVRIDKIRIEFASVTSHASGLNRYTSKCKSDEVLKEVPPNKFPSGRIREFLTRMFLTLFDLHIRIVISYSFSLN